MSVPLVVTGVLMFVTIPGMSDGFYLAYAYVTYIIWGTLYSTVNIPYGSMASVMTASSGRTYFIINLENSGCSVRWINHQDVVGPMILFIDNKPDAGRFFLAACIFWWFSDCLLL